MLFRAFGVVLFSSVIDDAGEARPAIVMFAILWCTTTLMFFGDGVNSLVNPNSAAGLEINIKTSDDPPA